ncbi:MAG: hypothetical protein IPO21_01235 [Bacteroidales bacterium]|nr:hypothetical protein [Bacteroidales bacterium]
MAQSKIISTEIYDNNICKIIFEKDNIEFVAGQHIQIKTPNLFHFRTYSFYSSETCNEISLIFKIVLNGYLTPNLAIMKNGEYIDYKNVSGNFLSDFNDNNNNYFISNGTGIAPFHSFIKSRKVENWTLVHGAKTTNHVIDSSDYNREKIILCTTEDTKGDYKGRVTQYFKNIQLERNSKFYICGSSSMIIETINILKNKGVAYDNISYEQYY